MTPIDTGYSRLGQNWTPTTISRNLIVLSPGVKQWLPDAVCLSSGVLCGYGGINRVPTINEEGQLAEVAPILPKSGLAIIGGVNSAPKFMSEVIARMLDDGPEADNLALRFEGLLETAIREWGYVVAYKKTVNRVGKSVRCDEARKTGMEIDGDGYLFTETLSGLSYTVPEAEFAKYAVCA